MTSLSRTKQILPSVPESWYLKVLILINADCCYRHLRYRKFSRFLYIVDERIQKASQFYHLIKGLLRNKDNYEKCNFIFLRFISKEYYYMEQKRGQQQKERIAKFKPWKWNFWAILNKTKKVDKIKSDIQKSRLRWFGHLQMGDEITYENGEKTTKRKIQNYMDRPNYKGYRDEGENWEEI